MAENTPPQVAHSSELQQPSVLHLLNQCNRRLERLLENLRNEDRAEAELRDIAHDLIGAVELDADIALACIFLCQIAGSYAVRHCIETAVVVVIVGRSMDKQAADLLVITSAALTMNVGMLRHNETFQNKQTPLTREEMAIVHSHPEASADLLRCAGIEDEEWISCVLQHHENDEGSGYPAGVASPSVTLNAKLLSLADRYCAQVSARNYRRSILPQLALRNLNNDHTTPVDPALMPYFVRALGDFPPGSLVRLQNGTIGVVSHRHAEHGGLTIHCLRDQAGALLPPAQLCHSADPDCGITEALSEDAAATRFSMKQIWGPLASL